MTCNHCCFPASYVVGIYSSFTDLVQAIAPPLEIEAGGDGAGHWSNCHRPAMRLARARHLDEMHRPPQVRPPVERPAPARRRLSPEIAGRLVLAAAGVSLAACWAIADSPPVVASGMLFCLAVGWAGIEILAALKLFR